MGKNSKLIGYKKIYIESYILDCKIIEKSMAATPVEILALKYPLCKELINKVSNKWQKRTKNMMTKWPKEGTFDVALCEEMETLIKNNKTKSISKKREKREAKRERSDSHV